MRGLTFYEGGPAPTTQLTAFTQTFTYDGVNRLQKATDTGGWTRNFGYDQFGNIWVSGFSGITPTGNAPASNVFNSRNQINGAAGGYDAAGNQTVVNGNTFSYDAENRPFLAQDSTQTGLYNESLVYDGLGRRVKKLYETGATVYVYDAFGQLAAEYSSTSTRTAPCTTCYLTYDYLGSVRVVTDQNGTVVGRHDYLPFGEEIPAGTVERTALFGANDSVNQKFTGQERDGELGLDYFQARSYGAALGRFTSPDPMNAGADLYNPQSWKALTPTFAQLGAMEFSVSAGRQFTSGSMESVAVSRKQADALRESTASRLRCP